MKTTNKIKLLAITTLVTTTVGFAQTDMPGGKPGMPPPPPGEMRGEGEKRGFFKNFFGERKEERKEFHEDMKDAREQFREDMKDKKDFMASTTPGTATPTPWKNLRENAKDAREDFREGMKDAKGEFKEGMKEMRDMMKPRMATLTDTQVSAIAGKLGITVDALKLQLASGTKLREIVKDKINPEDMKQIIPPMMATFTKRMEERGFFNNIRASIFGAREEVVQKTQDEFGEIVEAPTGQQAPRPFWQRFFGF